MKESGSGTILFITLVIPVIFIVTGILISMTSLSQKKERIRPDLEQSVLFGAKFLPDGMNACSLAESQLASRVQQRHLSIAPTPSIGKISFQCATSRESIQAIATGLHYLAGMSFSKNFLPREQQKNFSIRYSVAVKARIQPTDTFIYFDSSTYMAPKVSGGAYWGLSNQYDPHTERAHPTLTRTHQGYEVFLPVTQSFVTQFGRGIGNNKIFDGIQRTTPFWTSALYFRNIANTSPKIRESLKSLNPFSQTIQTQQCFNPALSPLKYAAIELYDSLTGSPINTATVATNHKFNENIYTIVSHSTDTVPPQSNALLDNIGSNTEIRDYDCLAASYADHSRKSSQSFINKQWRAGDFSYYGPPSYAHHFGGNSVIAPPAIATSPTGDLSAELHLRVRDAIWGRSISHSTLTLRTVLLAAKEALFPSVHISNPTLVEARAGLKHAVENRAFILLGDFPDLSNIEMTHRTSRLLENMVHDAKPIIDQIRVLAESQKKKTYIFVIFTRREEIYGNKAGCPNMLCQPWYDHFDIVKEKFSKLEQNSEYLDLVPIRASDPSTVAYETTSGLLRVGRTVILSTPDTAT